ncbi:hypothetical protein CHS0354_039992 [Potamilus streckersoni]|uniref:Uncharacterized protein n=1 Tax=Potamilus streckersoni TaxID=2493646 RepID=A0AAE0S0C9_9BIVA|nr:hypothetical protein CHS0354_039992 [Potamilus streckersoni]
MDGVRTTNLNVYAIIASKGNSIITTSGIMVDSNHCRRFMVDDRRELLYRAEVQNRVYRREIIELEQEISRVQHLLELPVQPYPKLTPELLYLLPESRVDPSPNARRRGLIEEDRYDFISDAADLCLGVSEARSDYEITPDLKYKEEPPKPVRRRSRRFSLRSAKSYAVHKLCKFRPRFSLGTLSDSYDYSGIKRSPFPEGEGKIESFHKNHSSHPLLKQTEIEEYKHNSMVPNVHQSNDRRKSRTFDTSESDDESGSLDEATVKIKCPVTLVTQASVSEHELDREQPEIIRTRSLSEGQCQRNSRHKHFLEVPSISRRLTLVDIDEPKNYSAIYRRTRSVLELERRARIQKLQKDLRRIQKELQDLGDLEYQVSEV